MSNFHRLTPAAARMKALPYKQVFAQYKIDPTTKRPVFCNWAYIKNNGNQLNARYEVVPFNGPTSNNAGQVDSNDEKWEARKGVWNTTDGEHFTDEAAAWKEEIKQLKDSKNRTAINHATELENNYLPNAINKANSTTEHPNWSVFKAKYKEQMDVHTKAGYPWTWKTPGNIYEDLKNLK